MAATFDPEVALQQVFTGAGDDERPLLLGAVSDDARRRAYAAWLAEHDPIRAEALRLDDHLQGADDPTAAARLAALVEQIDPAWWWVMRRSRIHNCGADQGSPRRVRFALVCPRSWSSLRPTGEAGVRHCEGCDAQVYRCTTVAEAGERARRGECIAVDPGMAYEATSARSSMMLGRPDYLAMWADQIFDRR